MADWDLRNSDIPVQIKCTICLWDEKSLTGWDRGIMWPNTERVVHLQKKLCQNGTFSQLSLWIEDFFFVFKISQQGIKAGSLKERNRTQKVYFSKWYFMSLFCFLIGLSSKLTTYISHAFRSWNTRTTTSYTTVFLLLFKRQHFLFRGRNGQWQAWYM